MFWEVGENTVKQGTQNSLWAAAGRHIQLPSTLLPLFATLCALANIVCSTSLFRGLYSKIVNLLFFNWKHFLEEEAWEKI